MIRNFVAKQMFFSAEELMSTIYLVITFNTIDSPNFTLPKNPACEEFEKWRAIHASVGDVGGVVGVGDVLAWVPYQRG